MRELQKEIIAALGVKPRIDPEAEVRRRVDFLVHYMEFAHARGFVLGISGGVDSTLGGRLAQLAAQKARTQGMAAEFVAVRLPYRVQRDEEDAQAALDFIQPDRIVTFNIASAVDACEREYAGALGDPISDFNKGNVKARLRMVAQYAIAADRSLLVVGTDHAAEAITGFYTKFGDGAADVTPLAGLNKRQIRHIVSFLGGADRLAGKVPTADLLDQIPGRTDETELGVSYENIDAYLEGKDVDPSVADTLEAYYMRTRHKRALPVTPSDTWWKDDAAGA